MIFYIFSFIFYLSCSIISYTFFSFYHTISPNDSFILPIAQPSTSSPFNSFHFSSIPSIRLLYISSILPNPLPPLQPLIYFFFPSSSFIFLFTPSLIPLIFTQYFSYFYFSILTLIISYLFSYLLTIYSTNFLTSLSLILTFSIPFFSHFSLYLPLSFTNYNISLQIIIIYK